MRVALLCLLLLAGSALPSPARAEAPGILVLGDSLSAGYGLMAGLVRLPVEGKDILIFSNIESPNGRHHGTVWASFDGGKTWPLKRLVYKGGFGYSSLSALQHFPIGTLKIDQSFVHGADHEDEPATIVTTIISMGQNLRMDVVAEGVETQAQLDFLRSHGCHYGQGHLFGHPLSGEDYLQLLIEQQGGQPLHASLFA